MADGRHYKALPLVDTCNFFSTACSFSAASDLAALISARFLLGNETSFDLYEDERFVLRHRPLIRKPPMTVPSSNYIEPVPSHTEVIEKAVSDWEKNQQNPLTLPADERAVGSLALLIIKRLAQAGLIQKSGKTDSM